MSKSISRFRIIALAPLIGLPMFTTSQAELPDMGTYGSAVFSIEDETLLGQQFMRDVSQRLKLLDDPVSRNYLQTLGDRLASTISLDFRELTFFLVDDPSINAFAGPGGHIGVHTGLLLAAENESELAAVIAHEIAHVGQRHLLRSFEQAGQSNLVTLAAVIAAAVLARSGSGQGTEAVIASAMARSAEQQLQFSRTHEQEADRLGLEMLTLASYDPRSMPDFFEKLARNQRYQQAAPEFLLTHPVTASRIADTRGRAETHAAPATPLSDDAFQLIQTRIAWLGHSATPPVVSSPHGKDYGQALQLLDQQEYMRARTLLKRLLADDNRRLIYYVTLGELERRAADANAAIEILATALRFYPNNPILIAQQAELLLFSTRVEEAYAQLSACIRLTPGATQLYPLLARAAAATGRSAEAHEAQAEHYFRTGQTVAAVDQLQRALAQPDDDPYGKIRRSARLKDMEAVAKREMAASAGANKILSMVH